MNTLPKHHADFLELKESFLRETYERSCKAQQCFVFRDVAQLDQKYLPPLHNGSIHSFHLSKKDIPLPPPRHEPSKGKKVLALFGGLLLLVVLIAVVPLGLQLRSSSLLEARLAFIRRLLNEAPLIEGYWIPELGNFSQSYEEIKDSMVGALFWPIQVPCGAQHLDAVQLALEGIDEAKRTVENNFGLRIVETADEMDEAHDDGMISILLGLEGHSLGSSTAVLRSMYHLGARFVSLTVTSCATPWAASSVADADMLFDESQPTSLTRFGQTILIEMNRLGMLVDISRLSEAAMMVAMRTSRAPLLLSNTSPLTLCNHTTSIPDHALTALGHNGGVAMLNVERCGERPLTVREAITTINYMRAVAGVNHVGLSGAPKHYAYLLAELARDRLWGSSSIKKLVGGNVVRVMREIEEQKRSEWQLNEDWIPFEEVESVSYCRYPET